MARSESELLAGTPYLIDEDGAPGASFTRLLEKSAQIASRAQIVGERIKDQAADVFESFGVTLRSELVAESNQIEQYDWTPNAVRELVVQNRDLLEMPAHLFMEGMRGDDRAYQAMGLYKAQLVADEWAERGIRPREIEIRQLHALITKGELHAGRYKRSFNTIVGSSHVPPAPADAAEGMYHLAQWLAEGTGDPSLDATVVHAWLVHLHPFEDGNGRLARLLANLALSQGGYPPLILSASSDRGEYYDALAASDDGNILPLYALFVRVMRRTVKVMSARGYVEDVIRDRLLVSQSRQRTLWQEMMQNFAGRLRTELRREGWDCIHQGYPNDASFGELAALNPDGNSWFMKLRAPDGRYPWLLWFGFNSPDYCGVYGEPSGYPSVFFSTRADDPGSVHPYSPAFDRVSRDECSELVFAPAVARPARVLQGYAWAEYTIDECVGVVAGTVLRGSLSPQD